MSDFGIFMELGWDHILQRDGLDHKLFVIALATIYQLSDWKKVLILITAFTIGHSLTLALATFGLVPFNIELIEFLIPVTIFLTAFSNLFRKEHRIAMSKVQTNYLLAIGFGLIHGLGFSTYLRSLLGTDHKIISQLLAFNLGLEVGQIIIVAIFLIISFIFVDLLGIARRDWRLVISSAVGGVALYLISETEFWQNITA
ncbi:MAG: HupE/UreJ family protein [Cyclobacteriaceae bacterium]